MNKPKFVIVALTGALVLSNAFWLYRLLDAGITYTYMQVDREDTKRALQQTLKLLPLVASGNATRAEIIAAAKEGSDDTPFEGDGSTWVGHLGLRFDASNRLVAVTTSNGGYGE